MSKAYKTIVTALLFFLVVTAYFYLMIVGIKPKHLSVMTKEEIEQTDLSKDLAPLTSRIFEWYPNELFSPEDFDNHNPTPGKGSAMYGTYRITLRLPKGKTYGMMGLTSSYAQRVFVNGALLSEVGNVSDNAKDFVARTDSFSVYFTPTTDETEIITQLAHWNNKNGYYNGAYLGGAKFGGYSPPCKLPLFGYDYRNVDFVRGIFLWRLSLLQKEQAYLMVFRRLLVHRDVLSDFPE